MTLCAWRIITGSGEKAFCAGADISGCQFDPEKARRNFMIEALDVLRRRSARANP